MENIDKEFERALRKQLLEAGDTQYINKEKQRNPTFIVNKLWLKNFFKIIKKHENT